jgi:DNA-binding NarL/FixJ family response regulator
VVEIQTGFRSDHVSGILLVDEEVIIRTGLRILIDSWPNSRVVGEVDSPTQAAAVVNTVKPDVIVCTYTGGSDAYFASIRDLLAITDDIPLVMLTRSRGSQSRTLRALAGTKSIILTKQAVADLRSTLERLRARKFRSGPDGETTFFRHAPPFTRRADQLPQQETRLTNREREVAVLVSQGRTNKQVGDTLGITPVTVRHHLTSIFHKLRITNRFELMAWLYRHEGLAEK